MAAAPLPAFDAAGPVLAAPASPSGWGPQHVAGRMTPPRPSSTTASPKPRLRWRLYRTCQASS